MWELTALTGSAGDDRLCSRPSHAPCSNQHKRCLLVVVVAMASSYQQYTRLLEESRLRDRKSGYDSGQADISQPDLSFPAEYRKINANTRDFVISKFMKIDNWDRFCSLAYKYYTEKGIEAFFLARIANLLTTAFVIGFSSFLFNCIDHSNISGRKNLSEVLVENCFSR